MTKKKLLLVDLTIMEDYCNLRCDYCGHDKLRIEKCDKIAYRPQSELYKILNSTMEIVHKTIDAPVLKISGGEIFMIHGILDFIKEQSKCFPLIQILTNATMLNENCLDQLQKLGNIIFQVSLDGHTFDMNKTRFRTEAQFDRVIKNILSIIDRGFAVEINTVINPTNIKNLNGFLDYLAGLEGNIRVFPYPVRWVENFEIDKNDIEVFCDAMENEKHNNILPSRGYTEKLVEVLKNKRTFPCFMPNVILGISESGPIRKCACGIPGVDMMHEGIDFEKVIEPLNIRNGNGLISNLCDTCFTNYDFYNLLLTSGDKKGKLEQLFFDVETPILNRLLELSEN